MYVCAACGPWLFVYVLVRVLRQGLLLSLQPILTCLAAQCVPGILCLWFLGIGITSPTPYPPHFFLGIWEASCLYRNHFTYGAVSPTSYNWIWRESLTWTHYHHYRCKWSLGKNKWKADTVLHSTLKESEERRREEEDGIPRPPPPHRHGLYTVTPGTRARKHWPHHRVMWRILT